MHDLVFSMRAERARLVGAARGRVLDIGGAAGVTVRELPGLPDDSVDTVICALVLCTVADQATVLADMQRVLRHDGQMLFLEHVLARTVVGRVQRLMAPAWAAMAGGCRLDRDTVGAIRAAGFVVTDCERPSPLGRISAQTIVRGRAIPRQRVPA
jgi:SAM-dependent methyltransferase